LVHDPIRAEERVVGYLFSLRKVGNLDRGVARSGVNGPLRWGSSSERFFAGQLSWLLLSSGLTYDLDDLVVLGALVRFKEASTSRVVCGVGYGSSTSGM
jgi:hypothetical protein